jgi:hypothetical protein
MIRRGVSLLVIAGLIAGQLAAIPHAHGAMTPEEQSEHNAVPHFHVTRSDHADHGQSHHGHGHSHSAKGHEEAKRSSKPSNASPSGTGRGEHDANAVYLAPHARALSVQSHKAAAASTLQLAKLTPLAICPTASQAKASNFRHWHPPDAVQDASGCYLTLRNLRI